MHWERGPVADLHERSASLLGQLQGRAVLVHQPQSAALVLGSTQPEAVADAVACAAAGVAVARRRSGGGAVLVEPGDLLWADLLLPVDDPLWRADVGQASWWVGEAWSRGLELYGAPGAEVWRGGLQRRPWSSLVCFAGLGPGEVTVSGRKVVGISQRRSRRGALFQTACALAWRPERLVPLLALGPGDRRACLEATAEVAAGAGAGARGAQADVLLDNFLAALPQ